MKKHFKYQILSLMLLFALVLSILPASALAQTGTASLTEAKLICVENGSDAYSHYGNTIKLVCNEGASYTVQWMRKESNPQDSPWETITHDGDTYTDDSNIGKMYTYVCHVTDKRNPSITLETNQVVTLLDRAYGANDFLVGAVVPEGDSISPLPLYQKGIEYFMMKDENGDILYCATTNKGSAWSFDIPSDYVVTDVRTFRAESGGWPKHEGKYGKDVFGTSTTGFSVAPCTSYSATYDLQHCSILPWGSLLPNRPNNVTPFNVSLQLDDGYVIADNCITVTVGTTVLTEGTDFNYYSDSGILTIPSEKINGDVSIQVVPVSRSADVVHTLTNLSATPGSEGEGKADSLGGYSTTLTADKNYFLPKTIDVTIGNTTLTVDSDYTYDSKTGILTVTPYAVSEYYVDINTALTITAKGEKVQILEDDNKEFTIGDSVSFRSSAPFDQFQKVMLDNKDLPADHYAASEGSTIITLSASYVKTLSTGAHTITIVSTGGQATANFTIKGTSVTPSTPSTPDSPATGDSSRVGLWISLLALTAGAVVLLSKTKKK